MENNKLMSPEEVELLLNFTLSTETNWEILIGTLDTELTSKILSIFSDDDQVNVNDVKSGCDVLVECALRNPDVLIIDEDLRDVACVDIIRCLRKNEVLKNIQILCSLKSDAGDEFPEWGANDYFKKYDLEKIYLSRKVNSLLYSAKPVKKNEKKEVTERRWPRTRLKVVAKVEMLSLTDSTQFAHGEAVLEDISRSGALLTNINLENGSIPEETFKIKLNVDQPLLKDWKADGLIVRCKTTDSAGVKFVSISKDDQLKIAQLFDK